MKKELNRIAKDTNLYLKRYIKKQKNSDLMSAMKYGLFPGGFSSGIKSVAELP